MRPLCVLLLLAGYASAADVTLRRVPDHGLEPQAQLDSTGKLHLIYFIGEGKAGDILYRTSTDAGQTFSDAMRVNSEPKAAMIVGAVRGPRLALDAKDRPHVIWSGSDAAQPKPRLIGLPLLYTRLGDKGFEPQRHIITAGVGIDGGASVAADRAGNVDILYHAPEKPDGNERSRRVWVTSSRDNFASRTAVDTSDVGACACCAVRAFYDDAGIRHVIFRGADQMVHRDMYLDHQRLSELNIGKCVMSTSAAAGNFIAWEGDNQILARDLAGEHNIQLGKKNPKHPAIAISKDHVLIAWTENTAWARGGWVVWELLDKNLQPITPPKRGRADDLPIWDYPAAFAAPDGNFVVLY